MVSDNNLYFEIKTSSKLQPADWEEREYIEDPDDVKPEVSKSSNFSLMIIEQKVGSFGPCDYKLIYLVIAIAGIRFNPKRNS